MLTVLLTVYEYLFETGYLPMYEVGSIDELSPLEFYIAAPAKHEADQYRTT